MQHTLNIYQNGTKILTTSSDHDSTILAALSQAGIFLDAPCGGLGKCGKCKVKLSQNGQETLACKTSVTQNLDVFIPDSMNMKIAGANTNDPADKPKEAEPLGVAVDIGTTSVVAHLCSLSNGTRFATASGVNAQRPYGADVISRIQYCAENPEGTKTLASLIANQLSALISETCENTQANPNNIKLIAIAGNTIMEHLMAGYSPVGMGTTPFTPVSLFGDTLDSVVDICPNAKIYYAPAISSYVGGDITAGMLASGLEETQGPAVYLDIGTNGEIAMKVADKYYCCATAAGPAFEGAEISQGMAAIQGAISHVKWDGTLKLEVIGNSKPQGLCGSGLLDALALLLETGAVDETGRLCDPGEISHDIKHHIISVNGKNSFLLSKKHGVALTASDIRKLQLAKSAIAAGINTLLHSANLTAQDIKEFVLAGGFGSYMDKNSAARIGLFPPVFLPVTKTLGNTAGEGAVLALISQNARDTLTNIKNRCEYIELSTSIKFNEQFVECMMF